MKARVKATGDIVDATYRHTAGDGVKYYDIDKSGYWGLLVLVPVVNFFFLLYLLFAKGTEGWNKYGNDPLEFE